VTSAFDEFARRQSAMYRGGDAEAVRERLVAGDTVVQLADGLIGESLRWRTVGVYRFEGDRVAEAWLVPLELAAFDAIWTAL
jgi:hypothetical protein